MLFFFSSSASKDDVNDPNILNQALDELGDARQQVLDMSARGELGKYLKLTSEKGKPVRITLFPPVYAGRSLMQRVRKQPAEPGDDSDDIFDSSDEDFDPRTAAGRQCRATEAWP